jgi:prepilin-type N-terminal cleavage/methylation domain-containing protein
MMPAKLNKFSHNGFTLVEIIVTLVVVGVLAAFFVHFMGTAIGESYKTMELVVGEAEAESKMEEIIARYVEEMNTDPDTALENLTVKIDNGDYNTALVSVTHSFVAFDVNGNEQTVTDSELLKITVEAPGNNLITILPKSRWKPTDRAINY